MSSRTEILEVIKTWPSRDRAEFAEEILATLDNDHVRHIEELCIKEAKDRLAAYERGELEALSEEETMEWLNKLGSR